MAKLTLGDVANLLGNPTSAANTINSNNDKIEAALEKTLSRDGTTPNQMSADIDLNNNDLLNVKSIDVDSLILGGQLIIPGEVDLSELPEEVMLKPTYDPLDISLDAFNRANHYGTLPSGAVNPSDLDEVYNFFADGLTSDSTNFITLESTKTGRVIDLKAKDYRVSSIPTGNYYTNGRFVGPFQNFDNNSDISQAYWTKQQATVSGTNLVIPTAVSGSHTISPPKMFVSDSFPLWIGLDARAEGYSIVRVRISNTSGVFLTEAVFNSATGAVISGSNVLVSDLSGDNYRRATMPLTLPVGTTSVVLQIWIYDNSGSGTFTGDGVSGISFRNITWGNLPYDAPQDRNTISSLYGTGGVGGRYLGGLIPNPTVPGRTTDHLYALIASQGCRSEGPSRAVNIGSIYSHAKGNVSGNYSSRQSLAWVPQSVNIASEECRVTGLFRGANIASIYSACENESNYILGSRSSYASGRNSGVIGSSGVYAGRGGGAILIPTVVGGVITSVVPLAGFGGARYQVGDTLIERDRLFPEGAGFVGTVGSVDSSGAILTCNITNGGSGYHDGFTDVVVDNGTGDFTGIFASQGYAETTGAGSAVIASAGAVNNFTRVSGVNSAVVGGTENLNDGNNAVIIASQAGAVGSGVNIGVAICANNSQVTASEALVTGRRTINPTTRTWAGGDSASGSPLSSNRKWEIVHGNGNVRLAGVLSQSQTFTDIAKMFENLDGEIPVGSLVTWEGRKVRLAQQGDSQFSVHSRTYSILLGDSAFTWDGRYVTGEFGEKIMDQIWDEEDQKFILVPRENPDFDPDQINIPRSERTSEWTPVALLGEAHVRVDSTVRIGDYVTPSENGVGTLSSTSTKMRCMDIRRDFDSSKGYAVALCLVL